ncbi:MAG: helix-turn-helix domain-containing protein [Spirochaetes bacterium]|nr:MAG: helix-turn-helix domain-containing protein [Spirochaetota bacterium]
MQPHEFHARIFESDLSPNAKLVCLAILRYRNHKTGLCYPSWDTISADSSLCRNTVAKAIREIEASGFFSIKKMRPKGSKFTVNSYVYNFDGACGELSNEPSFEPSIDLSNERSSHAPKLIKPEELSNISPPYIPPTKKRTKPEPEQNHFDEFWEAFPRQRRGSKDKAMKAYTSACLRASEGAIIQGTHAYARSDEVARGYAKGAAAWLNDDRWTNDYTTKPEGMNHGRSKKTPDEELKEWLDSRRGGGAGHVPDALL